MGKLVRGFMTTCFLGLLSTCMPLFAGVRPSASRPTNDHKATEPATISNLQIVPGHRDFEIVISQSRPLVPSVIKLSQPSRFVLDFPTFRPALTYTHLEVNRDGVKAIRIGRHDNPLSTRIVFDLVADLNHSLSSSKDGIKVRFSRLAFPTAKSEGPQAADPPQSAEQESARESQSPTSTTVAAQSPAPSGSTTYSENSTAPNAQKTSSPLPLSESAHDDEKAVARTNREIAPLPNSNVTTSIRADKVATVPPDFRVGPEDVLTIDVWKEQELSRTVPIRPDGKISLPLVGELAVADMTASEIRDAITNKLKYYISSPEVSVTVQTIKSQYVNVVGQVLKPGSYVLTKQMTVLDALALAGGFKDFAKLRKIYVLRFTPDGHSLRLPFDYKQVIKGRGFSQNVNLQVRDIVVVP